MSEFQYYDFQSIDRKLKQSEISQISKISSRVKPTSYQAIFTYSYSDFPKDYKKVLAKYFDAMLYAANWGTRILCFRFPEDLLDSKQVLPYCKDDIINLTKTGKYYILEICIDDEDLGGWFDEEGTLDKLLAIRSDLINGDYRALYLAWLKGIESGYLEDDDIEPPCPVYLEKISPVLKHFIKFFGVNSKLIKFAIGSGAQVKKSEDINFEKLIKKIPIKDRNELLLGVLNEEPHLAIKLRAKLKAINNTKKLKVVSTNIQRRTVAEIKKASKKSKQRKTASAID